MPTSFHVLYLYPCSQSTTVRPLLFFFYIYFTLAFSGFKLYFFFCSFLAFFLSNYLSHLSKKEERINVDPAGYNAAAAAAAAAVACTCVRHPVAAWSTYVRVRRCMHFSIEPTNCLLCFSRSVSWIQGQRRSTDRQTDRQTECRTGFIFSSSANGADIRPIYLQVSHESLIDFNIILHSYSPVGLFHTLSIAPN